MTRRDLMPRVDLGRWGGAALGEEADPHGRDARGAVIAIQWLGLIVEIAGGRVHGPNPSSTEKHL